MIFIRCTTPGACADTLCGLLGRTIMAVLISAAAPHSAASQIDNAKSEPLMCSRLKELTTEFPNPQADRLLRGRSLEQRCRQYFWYVLKIKPLAEILNASEIDIYNAALANRDCQAATALLRRRFAKTHPRADFILTDQKEFELWQQISVSDHFQELYLCQRLVEIDQAQRDLDTAGKTVGPYRGNPLVEDDLRNIGKRSGTFDTLIDARDRPVAMLLEANFSGESPVYSLALLKLSHRAVALELHPLWELFLAVRLREVGVSDPLVTRILSRPVDANIRMKIERHAKNKLIGWHQIPVHPHRTYPKAAKAD